MKADALKIADGVYWVGALDWDAREFHGYTLDGTTYNCYLVFGDDKVALIDNVYGGFFPQLWARIEDAFAQEGKDEIKIDVVVQNHIENDHSTTLPDIIEKFPDVEIYCTQVAIPGLKKLFPVLKDQKMNPIKTGDTLDLGGKTFTFINAPMLHWTDSNFTLYNEGGILFSNDAFGQHYCSGKRYDVEVDAKELEEVAKKYYANLITLSSPLVVNKVKEMTDAGYLQQVKMIAPCHGQIWTKPQTILDLYTKWATGDADDKITVIYDTMHHSTQKLAHQLAEGIISEGVDVSMHFLKEDHESDVVTDVLDSKAICLGVPTMMNNPYPNVGKLIYYFNCLSYANCGVHKKAVTFSSKGWGGGAIKKLNDALEGAGFDVLTDDALDVQFLPSEDELEKAYELGKKMAQLIKE
jgi:flavorubredoxin